MGQLPMLRHPDVSAVHHATHAEPLSDKQDGVLPDSESKPQHPRLLMLLPRSVTAFWFGVDQVAMGLNFNAARQKG